MFISCIGTTRLEYSSGAPAGNRGVSPLSRAALGTRASAVVGRPRVARGDLPERGGPPDLPPDGRALADGQDAELPRRGRARPRARRRHEGKARRARPGRGVPPRRRGVPRADAPLPLGPPIA